VGKEASWKRAKEIDPSDIIPSCVDGTDCRGESSSLRNFSAPPVMKIGVLGSTSLRLSPFQLFAGIREHPTGQSPWFDGVEGKVRWDGERRREEDETAGG
jgi:hypothetical protein